MLTNAFDALTADSHFARGYSGYLSTALPAHALIESLRALHGGRRVLAPVPLEPTGRRSWPGMEHGLTARGADVLCLIAAGLSNREIAAQLGVSTNSVKSYIRGAYPTIDVDSRTKAVLWSITHGLRAPTGKTRA